MIFEAKMMTIFSMLFGAGLVLMDQRAEARGAKIRGVYFRRILWLLVIGLDSRVLDLGRRHPRALRSNRLISLLLSQLFPVAHFLRYL